MSYEFQASDHVARGKEALAEYQIYSLLNEYFPEELEMNEGFLVSLYENPSYYLVGKKVKVFYLKSNSRKNTLGILHKASSLWLDIVFFVAVFVGISFTLISVFEKAR